MLACGGVAVAPPFRDLGQTELLARLGHDDIYRFEVAAKRV